MRAAGEPDDVVVEAVQAVRDRSTATIRSAEATDILSREFPEAFVREVGEAIRGKVTDRVADLVLAAVLAGVGKFFGLF